MMPPVPWEWLLAIAAGIVSLTAAGSALTRLFSPYRRLVERLEELETKLKEHDRLFKRDLDRFERNDERDAVMMDSIFALLEHARTDNSTGLMEAASKKMQAYLINRK